MEWPRGEVWPRNPTQDGGSYTGPPSVQANGRIPTLPLSFWLKIIKPIACFLQRLLRMDRILDIAPSALRVPDNRSRPALRRMRERKDFIVQAREPESSLQAAQQQATMLNTKTAVRPDDCIVVGSERPKIRGSGAWRKWTVDVNLRVSFDRLQAVTFKTSLPSGLAGTHI